MDVGLIAAAQAVEHYEITRYGALIAWATELGRTDCVPLFKANLAGRRRPDQTLTAMAERRINPKAEEKPAEVQAEEHGAAQQAQGGTAPGRQGQRNGAKKARRRA